MNRVYKLLLSVILICVSGHAQTAKLPYPVIFLHGLVSSDATWNQAVSALGGSAKVFDVCLNHDGNTITASLTASDISVIGWRDGTTIPSVNRLYVMNFDQTRFLASGHSAHMQSNQGAIFKQGVALKAMIQAVLEIEQSEKVILVGHSMGGLEAREYLQRGYNGTAAGRGTNWVDQTSPYGHRVARLVTTGTPHLGSNQTGVLLAAIAGIDEKSEACRDLRYPYSSGFPLPVTVPAPFLFGGMENLFQWSSAPYNKDVNCNGTIGDQIMGLNSGTADNSSMPLPSDIRYTWITSNLNNSGQDMLVETPRQWLYNGSTPAPVTADTLLLGINHIEEPNDVTSIIRGMDESEDTSFAYRLTAVQVIKGFITYGMNWKALDKDVFRYQTDGSGTLTVTISSTGSGVDSIAVSTSSTILQKKAMSGGTAQISIVNVPAAATYYVHVWGTATASTYLHPYALSAKLAPTNVERTAYAPYAFVLHQNFPNPFNPTTNISFTVPVTGNVCLTVFNILGVQVCELFNGVANAGERQTVAFDAANFASGVYFYHLKSAGTIEIKKMQLIR